jgi:MFS family permease
VTSRELLTANVMMLSTRFLQYTLGAALGGLTAAQFGYTTAFIVNSLSFVASALCIVVIPAARMKRAAGESVAAQTDEQKALVCSASSGEIAEAIIEKESLAAISLNGSANEKIAAIRAPAANEEQPADQAEAAANSSTQALPRPHFFTDVREGLAYIWATPFVRAVILLNVLWATGGGMPNLLFDQIGGRVFANGDRGDWSVAVLFTASGAGVFLGMMLARRVGDWMSEERRAARFIGWSLLVQGVLFAGVGLMPTLLTMALLVTASRVLLGVEFGVQETMMMRVLPDEYRGRVFTTDRSLEFGMMTLSMTVASWLLNWFSPRDMLVVSGLLSASPGLLWLLAIGLTKFRVPARAVRESFGD